uniref:Uncharacterized protein n=1 Tax=Tanacetum cinerariifolium TaxID=118510 RepID=A0A6L2MIL0_TANCI|nr:hypothetical protein [Tanacetum cinerariifolium]
MLDLGGCASLQKFIFNEYGIRNMILHTDNSFVSLLIIVSEKDLIHLSDSDLEFSSVAIAMNYQTQKIFLLREWSIRLNEILLPSSKRALKSSFKISSITSILKQPLLHETWACHLRQDWVLVALHEIEVLCTDQVEGMLKHKEIYVIPSHLKKIFANMKRHRKDFSAKKQKSKKSKKRIIKVPQLSESAHDVADEHSRVLALEITKANQALKIGSLKRRVKKLKKKASKKAHKLKILYKIDNGVVLVDETQGRNDQDMFDTSIFNDEEVVAKKEVSIADPVTTVGEVVTTVGVVVTTAGVKVSTAAITSQIFMDEITLGKDLIDIKTSKPMTNGIVMKEPSERPTPTQIDSS